MSSSSENAKFLYQLDDFDIDAESLFKEYPPVWNDDNKLIVFEIAKSSGYPFSGKISYRRWRPSVLPKRIDNHRLKFSAHPNVFQYAEQKDPKMHLFFHLDACWSVPNVRTYFLLSQRMYMIPICTILRHA